MGILELRYCADGFLIPPKSLMISTCFDLELMIKQSHLFVAHLVTIQNTMISSLSMRKLELSFKFSSRSTHGNNKFDGLDCGLLKHNVLVLVKNDIVAASSFSDSIWQFK